MRAAVICHSDPESVLVIIKPYTLRVICVLFIIMRYTQDECYRKIQAITELSEKMERSTEKIRLLKESCPRGLLNIINEIKSPRIQNEQIIEFYQTLIHVIKKLEHAKPALDTFNRTILSSLNIVLANDAINILTELRSCICDLERYKDINIVKMAITDIYELTDITRVNLEIYFIKELNKSMFDVDDIEYLRDLSTFLVSIDKAACAKIVDIFVKRFAFKAISEFYRLDLVFNHIKELNKILFDEKVADIIFKESSKLIEINAEHRLVEGLERLPLKDLLVLLDLSDRHSFISAHRDNICSCVYTKVIDFEIELSRKQKGRLDRVEQFINDAHAMLAVFECKEKGSAIFIRNYKNKLSIKPNLIGLIEKIRKLCLDKVFELGKTFSGLKKYLYRMNNLAVLNRIKNEWTIFDFHNYRREKVDEIVNIWERECLKRIEHSEYTDFINHNLMKHSKYFAVKEIQGPLIEGIGALIHKNIMFYKGSHTWLHDHIKMLYSSA